MIPAWPAAEKPDDDGGGISGEISSAIEAAITRFVAADGTWVDYEALHRSDELKSYADALTRLAEYDPGDLGSQDRRLAFWINLFNMSVIRRVSGMEERAPVRDDSSFFQRKVLSMRGCGFSLADIEHGVLRNNSRPPLRPWRQFRPWDARLPLRVQPADPRVCFALVRGSRSSPALRLYRPELMDGQLDRAAESFINAGGAVVDREAGTLSLSSLFRWYAADFGGGQGVMKFVASRLSDPADAASLRSKAGSMKVVFQKHDWSLNNHA